jgi:hypothetical protein
MIVEAFDPVNDVESSLGSGVVSDLIDAFDFQGLEETLRLRLELLCVPPIRNRRFLSHLALRSSENYQNSDVRETGAGSPEHELRANARHNKIVIRTRCEQRTIKSTPP